MQKTLFFKILIIGGLMLLLCVPLMMIQSTIADRIYYRSEAVRSIAADSVAEQTLLGPVLVIPYNEAYEEEEVVDEKTKKTVLRQYVLRHRHYVYPNELQVNGNIDTDQRHRGIHQVLVYSGQHTLSGDFVPPAESALIKAKPNSRITIETPYIAFGLSDTRGLRNFPKISWDGKSYEFQQGSRLQSFKTGIHAPLKDVNVFSTVGGSTESANLLRFSLKLSIDGIEQLHFVPLAKNNQVSLSSKWPHPQFSGRFLPSPKGRKIDDTGFAVNWAISSLSSNAQQQLTALEHKASSADAAAPLPPLALDSFSVGFIEPVNIYSQADRAVKYGLLFVALTFAAFFLFEVLKRLPVHPVQYLLTGLALALFFLLLVSLSEKISFVYAYLVASSACILLLGFYLAYALQNWKRGVGFGIALSMLYAVLYGLLQSESNALVMGSILLFGVLTVIMIVTRKVDWYQIGKPALPVEG